MRVWMGLMASVIGSVCGSLALHKKLSIHDINFSLLAVLLSIFRAESFTGLLSIRDFIDCLWHWA